jgi:integrase
MIREDLRAFLHFSFVTGLRQGTVRLLRWKWLREGILCVPPLAVKNRVPIRQSLPPSLVEELGRRGEPEELIFGKLPQWPQEIWKEFQKACRRAEVPVGMPHDCRRTFANQLAMNGVPTPVIMRLGGWKSAKVIERYYLTDIPDPLSRSILERLL